MGWGQGGCKSIELRIQAILPHWQQTAEMPGKQAPIIRVTILPIQEETSIFQTFGNDCVVPSFEAARRAIPAHEVSDFNISLSERRGRPILCSCLLLRGFFGRPCLSQGSCLIWCRATMNLRCHGSKLAVAKLESSVVGACLERLSFNIHRHAQYQ